MDVTRLRTTLQQLQQATRDHAAWHVNLLRTIVCRLPCYPEDLGDDAHLKCRFGQWYYADSSADLREKSVFSLLGEEHRRVHEVAARLLREMAKGEPTSCEDYDALVTVDVGLRLELDALQQEIQGILRSSDALTGAYGRSWLLPELRAWRELVKRDVQQCCVAFMDIDNLKEVNDRHGHLVGDQVLTGAIRYVTSHLRTYDKVFRYGGDEFLLTLPGVDIEGAMHLIERIRDGFARQVFALDGDGRKIVSTASFGVAQLEADISIEESIDRADKALLLAKGAGRNQALSWTPAIRSGTRIKFTLHGGVAGNELNAGNA
jgi:diguanylate cyclase (GGDEF)-like protein